MESSEKSIDELSDTHLRGRAGEGCEGTQPERNQAHNAVAVTGLEGICMAIKLFLRGRRTRGCTASQTLLR